MKNIIIINDYCYVEGGASKVAITSAIALAELQDVNVYFIGAVGPVCDELKESKVKEVYSLYKSDCLNSSNRLKGVVNNIYNKEAYCWVSGIIVGFSQNNTIIHIHTWTKALSSSVFSACNQLGFKIVLTAHDYFLSCPNGGFFNYKCSRQCSLKPLGMSCVMKNCDSRNMFYKFLRIARFYIQNKVLCKCCSNIHLIYISEYSMKLILDNKNWEEARTYYLNDPIDIEVTAKRAVAEKHGEYIFLGRVSEEKGIRIFCKAITAAHVKGTVIGNGPLLDELKSEYSNIKFLGWRNRSFIKNYMYDHARTLIFSSLLAETLGMTVLEAQSYGIPSITANDTATSENVIDGETGFIFKNGPLLTLLS